jgi:aminoglycoside phosphotransferase (APT) family kinase protein
MEDVLQKFQSEELLRLASSLRPEWGICDFVTRSDPSTPSAPLTIKTGNGFLLILKFTHNPARWAVRIPRTYKEDVTRWAACWIHPLEFITESLPDVPAPRIHSYSLLWDEPVRVPFILLDWIEGKPLPAFTHAWPNHDQRVRILDQLSDILLNLIFCPLHGARGIRYYGNTSQGIDSNK